MHFLSAVVIFVNPFHTYFKKKTGVLTFGITLASDKLSFETINNFNSTFVFLQTELLQSVLPYKL